MGPALTPGAPVVLLLPGRAQPTEFMAEFFRQLALPLAGVILSAENDSWYPGRFMESVESNQPHLDNALDRIDRLIVALTKSGTARNRIALVGFSQGACVVSEYLLRQRGRWGALVAMTGGLFGPVEHVWPPRTETIESTPVLLTNSDRDPWVPLSRTRQTAQVFRTLGAIVSERIYAGRAHLISPPEIDAAREMLANL